ncbi:hypothetical protein CDIK_1440 [Cucumispora dikerogammari]|nr:hypothetical protein CDIK_1440 [Cucumispora dikerogammari]
MPNFFLFLISKKTVFSRPIEHISDESISSKSVNLTEDDISVNPMTQDIPEKNQLNSKDNTQNTEFSDTIKNFLQSFLPGESIDSLFGLNRDCDDFPSDFMKEFAKNIPKKAVVIWKQLIKNRTDYNNDKTPEKTKENNTEKIQESEERNQNNTSSHYEHNNNKEDCNSNKEAKANIISYIKARDKKHNKKFKNKSKKTVSEAEPSTNVTKKIKSSKVEDPVIPISSIQTSSSNPQNNDSITKYVLICVAVGLSLILVHFIFTRTSIIIDNPDKEDSDQSIIF